MWTGRGQSKENYNCPAKFFQTPGNTIYSVLSLAGKLNDILFSFYFFVFHLFFGRRKNILLNSSSIV